MMTWDERWERKVQFLKYSLNSRTTPQAEYSLSFISILSSQFQHHIWFSLIKSYSLTAGRCLKQWNGHVHLPVRGSLLIIQGIDHNDHRGWGLYVMSMQWWQLSLWNIKLFSLKDGAVPGGAESVIQVRLWSIFLKHWFGRSLAQ